MSVITLKGPAVGRELADILVFIAAAAALLGVAFSALPPVVFFAVITFVAGMCQVDAIFVLAIFFLPISFSARSDLPISDISSLLRLVLAAGVLSGNVIAGRHWFRKFWSIKLNQCLVIYLATIFLSWLFAGLHSGTSAQAIFHLLSYVALYFAVAEWAGSSERLRTALITLMFSSVGVAAFAFVQRIADGYTSAYFALYPNQLHDLVPWDGRVTSFLNYSNSLAGYLDLVLAVALGLAIFHKDVRARTLSISVTLLCTISLFLTQSRGGIAGFGGILCLAVMLFVGKKYRWPILVVLCVSIPLIAMWIDTSRYQPLGYDPSAVERAVIFISAWNMFLHSPILGVGYGNFKQLFDGRVLGVDQGTFDVHNLYLQHLTEVGIIGFCVFAVLIIEASRYSYRSLRGSQTQVARCMGFVALAAIAATLIHGFVDFLFIVSPPFGSLFWCLLGLLVASNKLPAVASAQ